MVNDVSVFVKVLVIGSMLSEEELIVKDES